MYLETTNRIRCARMWCQRHWHLLRDPSLKRSAKFQFYKTFVRPILTYGCEVWTLDNRTKTRLQRFESSILFEIYKSKYPPRHPKRLRPNPFRVFAIFRDKGIVEHVTNDRATWDTLLCIEESVLNGRRADQKCISWKDSSGSRSKFVNKQSELRAVEPLFIR